MVSEPSQGSKSFTDVFSTSLYLYPKENFSRQNNASISVRYCWAEKEKNWFIIDQSNPITLLTTSKMLDMFRIQLKVSTDASVQPADRVPIEGGLYELTDQDGLKLRVGPKLNLVVNGSVVTFGRYIRLL